MRSIWILRLSMMLAAAAVGFAYLTPSPARAEEKLSIIQRQCPDFSKQLEERATCAAKPVRLIGKFNVWPSGNKLIVELDDVAPTDSGYVAGFVGTECQVVPVVFRQKDEKMKTTTLEMDLPDMRFGWWQTKKLVLVSFPVKDGKLVEDSPGLAAVETVRISNWRFSFLMAVGAGGVAYWLAVIGLGRKKGQFSWNPVYLTSDRFDKASLSRFQLLGFTLLVASLLVFGLARVGLLSDISEHVLWLLGISAGGTVGTKVAEEMKQRLSLENWSWLRNQGWLTAHEEGTGTDPDPSRSRWGDLLKAADGSLDIYSFQLAIFSAVVAFALLRLALLDDIRELATFAIPQNLLVLLGLSNGVYIGGKTVAPKSWEELDRKLGEVRQAEKDWFAKLGLLRSPGAMPPGVITPAVMPVGDQEAKRDEAVRKAPDRYAVYIAAAREAARMLKALFGAEDTKFKTEPVEDHELMPRFP